MDLLDGLNPAQRQAVTTDAAPLCILAGAGSGKTRVLTRRIAHRVATGSADPRHVLALTFTRKAAGELSSRLHALGVRDRVAAGTFHAIAYAQLRRFWADRGVSEPALLDRKVGLLSRLLGPARDLTVQPIDLAAEIEWAKARMVGPEAYADVAIAAGRRPPLPVAAVADLYERYEQEKRRRGVLDFDDLLLRCAHALETDASFGAAQRWRFRHLFVDEFQDVNPVQFRLLEGWRGTNVDLCVVGDPNQAIYSWNGADPTYLTDFRARFPGAEVVALEDNYRSTPQVLAIANVVIGSRPRATRPLRPNRADGLVPTVQSFASDVEEAEGIARALEARRRPGVPWSAMAVLIRTNAQSVLFEEAFRAARIPFRVRGGGAFLDQPEVKDALSILRSAPARVPFASLLDDIPVDAVVRLGHEYLATDPLATTDGFLAWLAATVRNDEPEGEAGGVEISTFHRSKGLEWPVVFVAGIERGFVPIGHADSAEAVAEERRLLYVAVTRAQRELHCSWAERRTFGTKTTTRAPSPWLATIEGACAALAGGGEVDWRGLLAAERERLSAGRVGKRPLRLGANADPGVLAALKQWRSSTAQASGVPPFVIFHDTTLAAVAEARPRDRDSLLAVPGLGPVKADRYGEALLRVVAEQGLPA